MKARPSFESDVDITQEGWAGWRDEKGASARRDSLLEVTGPLFIWKGTMFPVAQDILHGPPNLLEFCEGFGYSPMFYELEVDSNGSGSVPSWTGLASMLVHD